MDRIKRTVREIADALRIGNAIDHIYFEEVNSPWNEKAEIKRKKGRLDIKLNVWNNPTFIYGRIYHLFLYISDVLNPDFQYNPALTPDEEQHPQARNRYNQIWSIYVDSRIERMNIESFYDRTMRRNLFIDMEKGLPWKEAERIFTILWHRESYTYPEIVHYAHNLHSLMADGNVLSQKHFETQLQSALSEHHAQQIIQKLPSPELKNIANELLSFTAYTCRDIFIQASHYGILFLYNKKFFAEMIPTQDDGILFTLLNPYSFDYTTFTIVDNSCMAAVQETIKQFFHTVMAESESM